MPLGGGKIASVASFIIAVSRSLRKVTMMGSRCFADVCLIRGSRVAGLTADQTKL
jgi:hypothetical protein